MDSAPADKTSGPESIEVNPPGRSGPGILVRISLLLVLACLLAGLVGVVWVLPEFVDETESPANAIPVQPQTAALPSATETKNALLKAQAERALQEVLQRQAVAESQEVSLWGGQEYEEALLTLAEADAAFGKGSFEFAEQKYLEVVTLLENLEASKPRRFADALERGAAALSTFDQDEAVRQFDIALALHPENEEAKIGAERAKNVSQLRARLDDAQQAETDGQLELALKHYNSALELDPRSLAALRGVEQVSATLKERRFRELMSQALAAVQGGAFEVARNKLSEAEKTKPGSKEVRDAETRLQLTIQEYRISNHRRQALEFARDERWKDAANEYAAALAVDPQAQFAVLGLSRSQRLVKLHEQLDKYLNDPKRFRSEAPRNNARALIDMLDNMEDKGALLSSKHLQLIRVLDLAETPVRVLLRSDGLTEVIINKVGVFGTFQRSEVTLLPGEYVARGHRTGYRDVRIVFSVKPGEEPEPVVIQCEETI